MAIRGTTVVIPAALAWEAAREVASRGGARQGFLGVSSLAVTLPVRQRAEGREDGLLVTGLAERTPAEQAGLLVGDVIVAFDGVPVHEPDDLLTLLRGDRVESGGAAVGGPRWRTCHRDCHGDRAEARVSCDLCRIRSVCSCRRRRSTTGAACTTRCGGLDGGWSIVSTTPMS